MGTLPTLSYSQIRTYLECPLRWKFLYIDRLSEAPRGYFSFGRTVHSVLEELLQPFVQPTARRAGGSTQFTLEEFGAGRGSPRAPLDPEGMLALYDRLWVSEGYESPEDEERYRALGRTLLLRYHREITTQPPTPVAVEAHLETTWDGIPVHGYVDRIDLTPSGGLEVLDYKTGRGLTSRDALTSEQLGLYQVLVERNYPYPVERLALIDLRGGSHLVSPPRPAEALAALRQSVGEVADGIRDEEYAPTPGRPCARCEFQDRCPEFREVPAGERAALATLVDRFAELREVERGLGEELASTARTLHTEAERLGVHRIPGARGLAIRRRETRPRGASSTPGSPSAGGVAAGTTCGSPAPS
ncbi:MAG: PD-(D/E)XK nuclease family protein [Thermoplasmata archaeon]|nr:PD-(D/E)XK nuclease family protein [Thermoplasmata archaeon]